jgi:hypothetical protein
LKIHAGSRSRDSSVVIATGWTAWGSIPGKSKRFYFLHNVQTDFGAHPTSNTMGTGELNRPESEADHSFLSNAEVKKVGAMPPLPHTLSWLGFYLTKLRDNSNLPMS